MFANQLKSFEANKILLSIEVPEESRENRFNEEVLRMLCLNQAIEKMQKELGTLFDERACILENFDSN